MRGDTLVASSKEVINLLFDRIVFILYFIKMIGYLTKFVIAYIVLLAIFFSSLVLTNLIPSYSFKQNLGKTIITFQKEGTYPSVGIPGRTIVLDNFTDPLMFNTAYSVNSQSSIQSALINLRYTDSVDALNQIHNLNQLYQKKVKPQTGYERHWHGYLVFLRPLLLLFPYSGIRTILAFALYGGLIWFCYLAWHKLGKKIAIFILFGLISVDFFFLSKSIQFSSIFLVGLFISIYLLLTHKKNRPSYVLFFVAGGLTSFFDLLTAPLISLGVLLITATALNNRRFTVLHTLSWVIGYLSLWFSKWILAEILFVPGAITISLEQIVNRTVTVADTQFSYFKAIKLNFFQLVGYHRASQFIFFLFIIILIFLLIRYFSLKKQVVKRVFPWVFIAVIPYLWYLVAANHSYLHCWYTYRNQFMSVVAGLLIISEFINWSKLNQDLVRIQTKLDSVLKPTKKNIPS